MTLPPKPSAVAAATGIEPPVKDRDAAGYYEAYVHFARQLRTWFVGFGVGAPVLLLTQDSIRKATLAADLARDIAFGYLLGVCLQVAAAIAYKTSMWYVYVDADQEPEARGVDPLSNELPLSNGVERQLRTVFIAASVWLSEAYWVEFLVDVSTVLCFAYATYATFIALGL